MLKGAGVTVAFLISSAAFILNAQPQSMREAAHLDATGRCKEAEAFYQAALEQGSPSSALLNNSGNHYLTCGQTAKAKTYFERLLQIDPAHVNANIQLARIAANQRRGATALKHLARVEETTPILSLLRAEANHLTGNRERALALLDGVEKQAASDPHLLFPLGITLTRLALYERAQASFHKALANQPANFAILFHLGRAAARAQDYEAAERALEAALKIRPADVELLLELGTVCAARQNYARAVFVLAQARQKAPERTDVLRVLAQAAYEAGYFDDSAKTYDEYVRLRPDDDGARRDRARAYASTETRRLEGRTELERYVDRNPADPLGHYFLAQTIWKNEPEESLVRLTEAARLAPNSASIRVSRAWMLQRHGQMAESLPDLEAANRLAPDDADTLDLIGLAHLALEQPAEAEKTLRQALIHAPDNAVIWMHLGRALMALDRVEEAQTVMERYRSIRPRASEANQPRFGMIELATLTVQEQREREVEYFRQIAKEHPDRPTYQLHLASLLLADDQKGEARKEFGVLLERNADDRTWENAGTLLLRDGEYALAREFFQRAAALTPSARLDLALAVFHVDGPEPALAFLETLSGAELLGDAWLLKAEILHAVGRTAEAEEALDQGLERAPRQPSAVQRAVALLVRLGRHQNGVDLLEGAIRNNSEAPTLPLLKAVVMGLMGRYSAAEELLREIELRRPEWDRAYLAHGLLLELAARPEEARQQLQTAAAFGSRDPNLECALARLSSETEPPARCACLTGLKQLVVSPECAELTK